MMATDYDNEQPPVDLLESTVEAIIFAAGEPVPAGEIASALGGVDSDEIEEALSRITQRYQDGNAGLVVEKVAGGYRLATSPTVGGWVRQFFRQRNRTRLTPTTLETLAVVAYRQPVTAPEIQAIRGKDPSYSLKTLLEKKMIRILGRKKVVGNPILYGTSKNFLIHFGLDSLGDLPSIEEFDSFLGALEETQANLFEEKSAEEPEQE
jgi:segregation and condensation protein B